MNIDNINNKFMYTINNVLKTQFNLEDIDIYLEKIPAWDSLLALQLMLNLEKEFGIKLNIYRFVQSLKLSDILKLCYEKLNNQSLV